MRKLFIPNDTSAVAMGSNLVANRFEELIKNKSLDIQIIRNGSRGMFWLEPLVEFESDFKRCLLYTSPSPRDRNVSRMPSSA